MYLPKLNERLIGKVLAHIKAFPETYNQNEVAISCKVDAATPCGAIGCFGGWAVLLGVPKEQRSELACTVQLDTAKDLVGFTENEADYVFATVYGNHNAKKDYKTIVARLNEVRRARTIVKSLNAIKGVNFDEGFSVEVKGLETGTRFLGYGLNS